MPHCPVLGQVMPLARRPNSRASRWASSEPCPQRLSQACFASGRKAWLNLDHFGGPATTTAQGEIAFADLADQGVDRRRYGSASLRLRRGSCGWSSCRAGIPGCARCAATLRRRRWWRTNRPATPPSRRPASPPCLAAQRPPNTSMIEYELCRALRASSDLPAATTTWGTAMSYEEKACGVRGEGGRAHC